MCPKFVIVRLMFQTFRPRYKKDILLFAYRCVCVYVGGGGEGMLKDKVWTN
jgi:hypothetical protein